MHLERFVSLLYYLYEIQPYMTLAQFFLDRFMKLRLDRVLAESYEADSLEEALESNPTKLEFEKPEKWVAPYKKYEYGWWEPFLPPGPPKPEA